MDGDQEWVKIQGQIGEILEPRLRKIIERISARSELAVPFIPYVGPAYPRAQTKILFVGKATDGWGWREDGKWDRSATLEGVNWADPDWYERLSEIPPQFMDCLIIPTHGGLPPCRGNKRLTSPFWRSIYRIGSDLLLQQPISQDPVRYCPRLSEGAFTSIAWTNVFKITYRRGNPEMGGDPAGKPNHRDPLIVLQEDFSTLQEEIEILRPKVVLFFTGPAYDPHLEKALPSISFCGSRGLRKVDGLKGLRKGGVALRTYHPGARGRRYFNAELIVRYIRECLG